MWSRCVSVFFFGVSVFGCLEYSIVSLIVVLGLGFSKLRTSPPIKALDGEQIPIYFFFLRPIKSPNS